MPARHALLRTEQMLTVGRCCRLRQSRGSACSIRRSLGRPRTLAGGWTDRGESHAGGRAHGGRHGDEHRHADAAALPPIKVPDSIANGAEWKTFGLPAVGAAGANFATLGVLHRNVGGITAATDSALVFSSDGASFHDAHAGGGRTPVRNAILYAGLLRPLIGQMRRPVAFLADRGHGVIATRWRADGVPFRESSSSKLAPSELKTSALSVAAVMPPTFRWSTPSVAKIRTGSADRGQSECFPLRTVAIESAP